MSRGTVFLDTELRKLRPAELYTLGQILNISDSWKKLMAIVPKHDASNLPKFNTEHFSMIEQAAQQQRINAAEIFLSEWGTMGKNRPTLRTLLNLLVKAELFRAADYVAEDILNEELPKRPECGPAAPVDISNDVIKELLEEKDEFEVLSFNESLIFGLPSDGYNSGNVNSTKERREMHNSYLEQNMRSTKLVSMDEKYNINCSRKDEDTIDTQVSDLMKFSTEQITDIREKQIFEQQEMQSCELPLFLNEFGQSVEGVRTNIRMVSEEFPIFLNNRTSESNVSSDELTNVSTQLSDVNVNGNEMNSTELPQCIVDLALTSLPDDKHVVKKEGNISQNALMSQELPITVLEYNQSR